jgi:putative two-component system response regulator
MDEPATQATCLIVDDDAPIRALLGVILEEAGYRCLEAPDVRAARRLLEAEPVDCLLLDLSLPGGGGMPLLRDLQRDLPELAVVIVTGENDPVRAGEAFQEGAYGYVVKPFQIHEVRLAVQNALERRIAEFAHRRYQAMLEREVAARTEALRTSRAELALRLAAALELRDRATGDHTERMSRYCALIGDRLGLSPAQIETLRVASELHDVGKIGIPDRILRKTGPLTAEEWKVMKTHTTLGHSLLSDSRDDVLAAAAEIALTHHERWHGTGYPNGLTRTSIPLFGRIAAVADVFDAASSDRSYRPAMPVTEVFELIADGRAAQYDPDVVDVFLAARDEVLAIPGAHAAAAR